MHRVARIVTAVMVIAGMSTQGDPISRPRTLGCLGVLVVAAMAALFFGGTQRQIQCLQQQAGIKFLRNPDGLLQQRYGVLRQAFMAMQLGQLLQASHCKP